MTILVFGKSGQVARELLAAVPSALALDRSDADLAISGACASAIERHRPRMVINAAAYTSVDRAEQEEALATSVNGTAPAEMARACAALDIPFVHLSTDYVFSGDGTSPWAPGDPTSPISAYGRSKLAGEIGVSEAGGRYAVLRTSWVFSPHGQNFVKTMLRLGAERSELRVVDDQIGGPTPAAAIAAACLAMAEQLEIDPSKAGIYHFSGTPDISWAGFAKAIFAQAAVECSVTGIATAEYPTPAHRPANSRLDCTESLAVFGIERPDWQMALKTMLDDLQGSIQD